MKISTIEEKKDSVQLASQEKRNQENQEIQNQQQNLQNNPALQFIKELSKIENFVYVVGKIEEVKEVSDKLDVFTISTKDKEILPEILCQKNKDFKPKKGKNIIGIGKINFIKDKFYIQLANVFYNKEE